MFRWTVIDRVPTSVAVRDRRTGPGCASVPAVIVTSTPPCCAALKDADAFSSSAPRQPITVPPALITGEVTCTCRTPVLVIVSAPGAVTVTVVVPVPSGSNAKPYVVPVVMACVWYVPALMVFFTTWPVWPPVMAGSSDRSRATSLLLLVSVTSKPAPPGRTLCACHSCELL